MPFSWLLWGALVFYLKCTTSAQDDLEAAAVTVYRNPEFFRYLSEEFNNYVQDFTTDRPFFGPKDEYVSPFPREPYQNEPEADYPYQQNNEDSESQRDAPDDEENYRDENSGGESEGGGFNTYDPAGSEREKVREPNEEIQREEEEDDGDGYKYPGEPKKPNAPGRPIGGGRFGPSPDFEHPARRLPPKKPKKKGRGPYGHPKLAAQEEDYQPGEEMEETPRYMDEFENGKSINEEQQLEDVENESQRFRGKDPREEIARQELKVFHNGQRYPVNIEAYSEPYEPLHEEFPLGHYNDHYQSYPSTGEEHYLPTAQSVRYPKGPEELQQQNHPLEFRDPKKGTREFLKFYKYPPNHELQDLNEPQVKKEPAKAEVVGCSTAIRQKRPRKFITYRVRPVYAHYKVVPVYYTTARRHHRPFYKRSTKAKPRSSLKTKGKSVPDNSAYVINSELDQDYQNLKIIKKN